MILNFLPSILEDAIVTLGLITAIWIISDILFVSVRKIARVIDASPYVFAFVVWWFTEKNKMELDDEIRKRFLSEKDYKMIERMQFFIDSLDENMLKIETMRYSELKYPLFIWHDKTFCKSKGNEVICLEDGRIGVIPDEEIIKSIGVYTNLIQIASALKIQKEMQNKFKEMGWPEIKPDQE